MQALPQDPTEWRRSYGRAVKSVYVEASFIPFSKDILPKQGDWHLIHPPKFHISGQSVWYVHSCEYYSYLPRSDHILFLLKPVMVYTV